MLILIGTPIVLPQNSDSEEHLMKNTNLQILKNNNNLFLRERDCE